MPEPLYLKGLRKKAEESLRELGKLSGADTADDLQRALEELSVYQAELEIQNEELEVAHQDTLNAKLELAELYDCAPVGYASLDKNGVILKCNRTLSNILESPIRTILDKPLTHFMSDEEKSDFLSFYSDFYNSPNGKEWICKVENGKKQICLELTARRRVLVSAAQNIDDVLLVSFKDVSKRVAAQEQLEQHMKMLEKQTTEYKEMAEEYLYARQEAEAALKAKKDFLAIVSHEIRTPLTGIRGIAQLLGHEELSAAQKEYVEQLDNSSSNLLHIVNDLLDYSKIEAGKFTLQPRACFLPNAIKYALDILRPEAEKKGIILSSEVLPDKDLFHVVCDPIRFRQVVLNFVSNAIKYTQEGRVHVRLIVNRIFEGSLDIRLEVEDTGIGIPETTRDKLFEPFEQVNTSASRKYGGVGLGLSICKAIVDEMDGRIGYKSSPTIGSIFWMEANLCKSPEQNKKNQQGEAELIATATSNPISILLVEDNQINSKVISACLEKMGHSVSCSFNAYDAIQFTQDTKFDLILMDIQMPEMDGAEATRQIRQDKENMNAQTPIYALTANVHAHTTEAFANVGFNGFVNKPVDWKLVRQIISEIGKSNGMEK